MFRRRKSTRHTPVNPSTSPSAQTAALQAFRASQPQPSSLSASAAAAALRSHTPPPTSVKDVQTKRMLRRELSNSSVGSAKELSQRGSNGTDGLRRTRSSGSMASRTFRESFTERRGSSVGPGPGRGQGLGRGRGRARERGQSDDIIPVPPLPQHFAASLARRKAASAERNHAPPPNSGGLRSRSVSNSSSYMDLGSRSSINFSYPMNARSNSPRFSIDSIQRRTSTEDYADSRCILRESNEADLLVKSFSTSGRKNQSISSVSKSLGPSPEYSTKESVLPVNKSDSTIQARKAAARESTATQPEPSTVDHRLLASVVESKLDHTEGKEDVLSFEHDPTMPVYEIGSGSALNPKRRPSTVPEAQEEVEDEKDVHNKASKATSASEQIHRGPDKYIKVNDGTASSKPARFRQDPQHSEKIVSPIALSERPHSLSPNRLTRFSDRLEIADFTNHLHQPPPRSVSPAKPALKASSKSHQVARPGEPNQWLKLLGNAPSDASDKTSIFSDDDSRVGGRKKYSTVSFEDEVSGTGQASSPSTSPELNVSNSRANEPSVSTHEDFPWHRAGQVDTPDELDNILKPRPELPSFGSIRISKHSTMGDGHSSLTGIPFATASTNGYHHSSSADHAIGGLLSRSNADGENSLAPLPPKVTSLEGTGFGSSSEESSDSEDDVDLENVWNNARLSRLTAEDEDLNRLEKHGFQTTPSIFIQPATPALNGDDPTEENKLWDDSESRNHISQENDTQAQELLDSPVAAEEADHKEEENNISTSERNEMSYNDSDTESVGSSVYSDAVEDLTEPEGDDFGSIDAIIDKNITSTGSHLPVISELRDAEGSGDEDTEAQNPRITVATNDNTDAVSPGDHNSTPRSDSTERAKESRKQNKVQPAHEILGKKESGNSPEAVEDNVLTFKKPAGAVHKPKSRRNEMKPTTAINKPTKDTRENTKRLPPSSGENGALRATRSVQPRGRSESKRGPERSVRVTESDSVHRPPQRSMSQGSDSSSSFKRGRRARPFGHFMSQRTMRGAEPWGARDVLSDSGVPFRELNNSNASRRPFSSDGSGHIALRTTMRSPAHTSRSKSSSFGGLKGLSKPGNQRNASSQFRSRFEDSSDDEMESLRPVRGIPRRINEPDIDSTDLYDSSDNESALAMPKRGRISKSGSVSKKGASRVANIAAKEAKGARNSPHHAVLSKTEHRKGGFFSRLSLSKRSNRPENLPGPQYPGVHDRDLSPTPGTGLIFNGSARPETTPTISQLSAPKGQNVRKGKLTRRGASLSYSTPPIYNTTPTSNPMTSIREDGTSSNHAKHFQRQTNNLRHEEPRPFTSDGVVINTGETTGFGAEDNTAGNVGKPASPGWTSRFRHPRRTLARDNSTLEISSTASDLGAHTMNTMMLRREKKGKFSRLKRTFGLS